MKGETGDPGIRGVKGDKGESQSGYKIQAFENGTLFYQGLPLHYCILCL